jgi:uncharacterized protein (TIGR02466 family)
MIFERDLYEIFKIILYANYLKLNNEKVFKKKLHLIYKNKKQVKKSNVGGYHSPNLSKNEKEFEEFLYEITYEANSLIKQYGFEDKLEVSNFWLNINGYKDYNEIHTHPDSILSGVYYVDVPKNSGDIVFENGEKNLISSFWNNLTVKNYTPLNSVKHSYTPKDNLLLLFPSWLSHSVLPNLNQKEKRLSISFNFKIKDNEN